VENYTTPVFDSGVEPQVKKVRCRRFSRLLFVEQSQHNTDERPGKGHVWDMFSPFFSGGYIKQYKQEMSSAAL
jgi:hypothetical protein